MNNNSLETIEIELATLARRFMATYKRTCSLDRSAYLLLQQIALHGSAGVKALADDFDLDISTVSRQAAALEKKGYVYKMQDPSDGRAYSLQITDLGTKELNNCKQARLARIEQILQGWSEEDSKKFAQLLEKFNHCSMTR